MDCETEEPPTSIVPPTENNFSQVVFTNVPTFYQPKTEVLCKYCKKEDFVGSSKDWVAIFKVGWKTTRDYYTWISTRTSKDNTVVFQAYYIPNDEEYYQFCYVDQHGEVRGASTPFQFCHNIPEDDDDDILMVTTELEIMKKNEENAELKKVVEELTKERSTLQEKVSSLQNENQIQAEKIQNLQDDQLNSTVKIQRLETENMELTGQLKSHEDEIEAMRKTIQSLDMDLKMQRSQEEKLLSELKEMEQSMDNTQKEKKHFEQLQIHMKTLEEKNKELELELKRSREKEKKILSDCEELKKSLEKSEAVQHLVQKEGMAKQKVVENLNQTINQCKEETIQVKADLELQMHALEKEKIQKENLRQSLDKEVKRILNLERNLKHKDEKLRCAEKTTTDLSKEVDSLKAENENKMKQMGVLHLTIAHLEGEVNRMKEECKAENENKIKQMGGLHLTIANLEGEVNRMKEECKGKQKAERTERELKTRLRSTEEMMHGLERQLAAQQDACRQQGEEILTLKSALELREEEIHDLQDIHKNNRIEIDDLHGRLLGREATSSMHPNQSLMFGNPYKDDTSFSRENKATTSSTSRRPPSPLCCPVCDQKFRPHEHQILEDHVMCHLDEGESRP